MHFEDIWNDAEIIADKTEKSIKEFVFDAKSALDKLDSSIILSGGAEDADAILKAGTSIGDVLFALCGITKILDINSAVAMRMAAEENKIKLLDPEYDD